MEKRGVVQPGYTKDVEDRLEKQAENKLQPSDDMTEQEKAGILDDDTTKRLMQRVVDRFGKSNA